MKHRYCHNTIYKQKLSRLWKAIWQVQYSTQEAVSLVMRETQEPKTYPHVITLYNTQPNRQGLQRPPRAAFTSAHIFICCQQELEDSMAQPIRNTPASLPCRGTTLSLSRVGCQANCLLTPPPLRWMGAHMCIPGAMHPSSLTPVKVLHIMQ